MTRIPHCAGPGPGSGGARMTRTLHGAVRDPEAEAPA